MSVTLETNSRGTKAVLKGEWASADRDALKRLGVRRLEINQAKGSVVSDLSFLAEADGLHELDVIHHTLKDDGGVQSVPGLIDLGLETYSQVPIDFRLLLRLRRLHFNWRPRGETALECTGLEELSVSGLPHGDLRALAKLRNLRRLRVANTRRLESLAGIDTLPQLQQLSLIDLPCLRSLAGVEGLGQTLERLDVDSCRRIDDVEPLAAVTALRRLSLASCGQVASLRPLLGLARLEQFYFTEATVIADGDLSVLLGLPSLREAWFMDRRHYSHRREEIRLALAPRRSPGDSAPRP